MGIRCHVQDFFDEYFFHVFILRARKFKFYLTQARDFFLENLNGIYKIFWKKFERKSNNQMYVARRERF